MPVSISGDGAITGLELEAFEDVDVGSGASDGDVLTYDASGDLWIPQGIALPAGIGSNVVSNFTNTTYTFSAASFGSESTDIATLATTITPTSVSSKVLIIAMLNVSGSNRPANLGINLLRTATKIGLGTGGPNHDVTLVGSSSGSARTSEATPVLFLDSPATTSAVTYNFRFINLGDIGQNMNLNRGDSQNVANTGSSVILIEVAA